MDEIQSTAPKTQWSIPGAIIIAGVVVAGAILVMGSRGTQSPSAPAVPTKQGQTPPSALGGAAPVVNAADLRDDDAGLGDPNAPVTIVEFSDFECPFCQRFHEQTLPQIQSEYIDTGKVYFVYRDFPLTQIHPKAQKAAEAGECAGDQGDEKFWAMHNAIFAVSPDIGVKRLKSIAQEIGLDGAAFAACLDSGEKQEEVEKDLADGQTSGITGTPGFVVGSTIISGAQPFSAFQEAIEAELAKEQ